MARPGIMLYFNIAEPISMLSDSDKGRLLSAMIEYGRDGVVPEFHGELAIVWSFIKPLVDKDGERYEDTKLQREYAAFCKKRKRIFMPKILFDDWVVMSESERQRAVDPVASRCSPLSNYNINDNEQYAVPVNSEQCTVNNEQLTNINMQLQPTIAPNNPQNDFAAAAADKQLKILHGELGKGVVMLSDEQISSLLDLCGLDGFDFYVDKLASFIIKNDAKVKNHYQTILKWFKQDSGVV